MHKSRGNNMPLKTYMGFRQPHWEFRVAESRIQESADSSSERCCGETPDITEYPLACIIHESGQ